MRPRAAADRSPVAAADASSFYLGRVTVLEPDALPVAAAHRKGVPQSRHAHALLAGGGVTLEELFPGLTDELVANGALSGDLQAEDRFYNHGPYRATNDPADDSVRLDAVLRPLDRPTLVDSLDLRPAPTAAEPPPVPVSRRLEGEAQPCADNRL
jgi:hypothetical protein